MPEPKPIAAVAQETAERIVAHLREDTTAADAAREADRDARVAAALAELRAAGKLPPPAKS